MNYNDAVKLYKENPTSENLKKICADLRSELTLHEKLHMMSGNMVSFGIACVSAIPKGGIYNNLPILSGGVKRLGIPAVRFTDGPRGIVMKRSTCFPVSTCRAAAFDSDLEYEIGKAMADEAVAQGANYFAGICINLARNPVWGRAQESYGEDPYLLGRYGVALTKAVQEKGVIACPKHYALNSIENLRFSVDVKTDDKTLHEVYLPHFKKCIDAGAMSIMGAYNLYNGDHCCESKTLLTDILRDMWGFEGFTITDFVFGLRSCIKAVNAGLDIEMPMTEFYYLLRLNLKMGKIKMEQIDTAVERILYGLIKVTPAMKPTPKSVICCENHKLLARRAAQEGIVMLKNDGVLPISKQSKVAVVGRYADEINVGDHGSSCVYSPYTVTPYEGFCNKLGKSNVVLSDLDNLEMNMSKIKECDTVVIFVGSDYLQEGENLANMSKDDNVQENSSGGDRYSLRIPGNEVEAIHKLCKECDKVVVNIIGGSAYIINEWADEANGIFESFYTGMEGGNAVAAVMLGDVNPSGHLPFVMAHDEGDYPKFLYPGEKKNTIEYEYYHGYAKLDKEGKEPDYPFGFGLSYTSFDYSNIKVSDYNDTFTVTADVKNTGSVDGKTVAQVYVGANEGDHPVKLLKGFNKQMIKAGEKETIEITVEKDDLKYYNPDTKEWYLEPSYTFYCGQDAKDAMSLKTKVKI